MDPSSPSAIRTDWEWLKHELHSPDSWNPRSIVSPTPFLFVNLGQGQKIFAFSPLSPKIRTHDSLKLPPPQPQASKTPPKCSQKAWRDFFPESCQVLHHTAQWPSRNQWVQIPTVAFVVPSRRQNDYCFSHDRVLFTRTGATIWCLEVASCSLCVTWKPYSVTKRFGYRHAWLSTLVCGSQDVFKLELPSS